MDITSQYKNFKKELVSISIKLEDLDKTIVSLKKKKKSFQNQLEVLPRNKANQFKSYLRGEEEEHKLETSLLLERVNELVEQKNSVMGECRKLMEEITILEKRKVYLNSFFKTLNLLFDNF